MKSFSPRLSGGISINISRHIQMDMRDHKRCAGGLYDITLKTPINEPSAFSELFKNAQMQGPRVTQE
jgi:hypothetical protein